MDPQHEGRHPERLSSLLTAAGWILATTIVTSITRIITGGSLRPAPGPACRAAALLAQFPRPGHPRTLTTRNELARHTGRGPRGAG